MARLHQDSDSDDSLPDLAVVLGKRSAPPKKQSRQKSSSSLDTEASPRKELKADSCCATSKASNTREKASPIRATGKTQKPLGHNNGNPLLLPSSGSGKLEKSREAGSASQRQLAAGETPGKEKKSQPTEPRTPRGAVKEEVRCAISPSTVSTTSGVISTSALGSEDDCLSDFVVSDAASEAELRLPPRSQRKPKQIAGKRTAARRRIQVLSDDESDVGGYQLSNSGSGEAGDDILAALQKLSLGVSSKAEKPIQSRAKRLPVPINDKVVFEPNAFIS